jgi:hypothetical protein
MAYTTINKSTDYFNTKLWTGTGANLSVQGVGHQPDFTWIKNRANTDDHNLFDVLRGFSTDALLRSNTSGAATDTTEGIKSFDSDGFSLGTNGSSNGNGQGMVSWNWKAGGAGSSNTDGSQSSTVSVNTTAGFSIVKFVNNQSYTTNTFGHGLGVVPQVIIMRSLDSSYNWDVHHHKVAISKRLVLNSSSGEASSTYMNSTSPTNQVFTVKSDEFDTNDNCIAYCFAEKTGYSKFGSYTGNGNADGVFVYLGFKPAFVITKRYDGSGQSWHMQDNKRDGFNYNNHRLFAESNSAESTTSRMDLLSNGFKYRDGDGQGNGQNFIYMAFAEAPLVGSNNVPCTAR